jgi:hypothetical protein
MLDNQGHILPTRNWMTTGYQMYHMDRMVLVISMAIITEPGTT